MILSQQQTISILAWGILSLSEPATTTMYELGNGSVVIEDPLTINGLSTTLYNPRLLGSGGGGAVFAYSRKGNDDAKGVADKVSGKNIGDVAVKFSWLRSSKSVANECSILKTMELNQVEGVERCLAIARYKQDGHRTVIVMEPVMDDSVGSLSEINTELLPKATNGLIRTLVGMLAANIVTTDVQPLISPTTGDLLLIDMTEAVEIPKNVPINFINTALTNAFCNEIVTMIPDSMIENASETLLQELIRFEQDGKPLRNEFLQILADQTIWTDEVMNYLETTKVTTR